MDFTAKLIKINEPITGEGKNGQWKRQEFIFETESQYPRKICVSAWGDRGIDPNLMQVGNVLTVSFDLESREFNGRWYTDVRVWKISLPGTAPAMGAAPQTGFQSAPAASAAAPAAPEFPSAPASNEPDDLPF